MNLDSERARLGTACVQLMYALTRLEGAMTAMAGNDERRLALAMQCRRLRDLAASLSTLEILSLDSLETMKVELEKITHAIDQFSVCDFQSGAPDSMPSAE